MTRSSTQPLLVVQHTAVCPPARVGAWLAEAGCTLDLRRCHLGDALPAHLDDHAGLVVLGGEMGAYDDDRFAWLGATKDLLSAAVRLDLPTLGICLGLQLLAVAEGGTVLTSGLGPQIGLRAVRTTPAARHDPLFGPLPEQAVAAHWNNDTVSIAPVGATVLSTTDAGLQSFRLGARVWAVQFHPEVTVGILGWWAAADVAAGLLTRAHAEQQLSEVAARDRDLQATWRRFTQRFGAVVTGAEAPSTSAAPAGDQGHG